MVNVDGSPQSQRAFETALAAKGKHDEIHVVHAVEVLTGRPVWPVADDPRDAMNFDAVNKKLKEQGEDVLEGYMKQCSARGITCKRSLLADFHPREAIVKYANENKVDTMYVGSRGLGPVKGLLLGSFSQYILAHSHCNIMVVKEGHEDIVKQHAK
eukprot:g30529.t1